jgi:hypothetical protein
MVFLQQDEIVEATADLEDEKFPRTECIGIDRVLKGWAKRGTPDEEILAQGFPCFDGLYGLLQRL